MLAGLAEIGPLNSPGQEKLWLAANDPEVVVISSAAQELRLAKMMPVIDRLFDRCADTVHHTDVSVLRWLRSKHPDRPCAAPFKLIEKKASEKIYRAEIKRYISFFIRIYSLESASVIALAGRDIYPSQRAAIREFCASSI